MEPKPLLAVLGGTVDLGAGLVLRYAGIRLTGLQ